MTGHDFLFTSESVTEGHPDKIADQISDGVLDALIAQDPMSRVACEVLVTTGLAFVAGEISSKGYVEIHIDRVEHDPFPVRRRHRRADAFQFHHVLESERPLAAGGRRSWCRLRES